MGRIIFVTGTDTGVGKTVVAAGVARCLASRGVRVVAVKPVESGCSAEPAITEDGVILARATGQTIPAAALTRLRTPVAPPVAADREGVRLDSRRWVEGIKELAEDAEIVLVEGAGGLLSPLTWGDSARDLAQRLDAEALIVASDKLGALNHILLTLEVLEKSEIPVLAVVFSAPETPDESTGQNAETLRRFASIERVASVPRLSNPGEAADHLEKVADWVLS
jgi:dethiobiotin synthetase